MSMLLRAADRGDTEAVRLLLKQGVRTHARDVRGRTALHLAAEGGHTAVIDLLLDAGADVNARGVDSCDYTPLHWAVIHDRVRVVNRLLDAGAEINAPSKDGQTALHLAVSRCGRTVKTVLLLQELLERSAHVNALDLRGTTPLHIAARYGCLEVTRLLLEFGADPNIRNLEGQTAVDLAQSSTVRALLATRALEKRLATASPEASGPSHLETSL